jgi:4-diphosphocytidyl-2-C-methyl-D-erythritol kinase
VTPSGGEPDTAPGDGARPAAPLHDIARAKVNLTLEIRGRRVDGYHELESLVAFTRFGDGLALHPGRPFSLETRGPFAAAIDGDNLIQKAAALYAAAGESDAAALPRGAFALDKQIPIAAGLGGGSADAAAALRLLASAEAEPRVLSTLLPLAATLGADVPACLFSRPAIMTGIGERLRFAPAFPAIPIVLVNPGLPLATAAVFRKLNAPPLQVAGGDRDPPSFATIDDVVAYARDRRNDLQVPAQRLLPVIGPMLDRLASSAGALLARLSGSGPTCFALFHEQVEAEAAAAELRPEHPDWWVTATVLG